MEPEDDDTVPASPTNDHLHVGFDRWGWNAQRRAGGNPRDWEIRAGILYFLLMDNVPLGDAFRDWIVEAAAWTLQTEEEAGEEESESDEELLLARCIADGVRLVRERWRESRSLGPPPIPKEHTRPTTDNHQPVALAPKRATMCLGPDRVSGLAARTSKGKGDKT